MTPKTILVNLEVPDGISEQEKAVATHKAHEAAVLSLWEADKLSTREAAEELDLAYGEFLDLLAAKGIPVERGQLNLEAIQEASQRLAHGGG
jgi:predicted HTH domain antitoxin